MDNTGNKLHFKFGRKLCRSSFINSETGIIIVVPDEKPSIEASQKIKDKFNSISCCVEILKDPEHDILRASKAPLIILGNISNSRCSKYLYYKLLCQTDKWYPGEGGYNIRTIINPFGTGANIIHIGYSDNQGLINALEIFLNKIANPLPYLNLVSYKKLPCADKYIQRIGQSEIPKEPGLIPSIHTSYWWYMGYMAYLMDDREQLDKYLNGWKMMLELSLKNPAITINTHLYMMAHVEIWRLLEYSGMLPDELRGRIEECIFNWAESSEGRGYVSEASDKILPSHNHSMFCALALTYAADFFKTQYAYIQQPGEWLQIADNVFYTFNNGGWKPYCDDSAYSNQVTLPLVCMYSIFEDSHRFLENGGKKAAEWIKVIIGQNGFVPSFGDGTVNNPSPAAVLRIMAHYYNDGELKYIHDNVPDERNMVPDICLQGMFDSGVKPVKTDCPSLINIIPLDGYIYDSWSKDRKLAERLTVTPPYGPYENCFDKLCIRTGWEEMDDFLLIDGLGSNGIHSYSDAMGVLDYTSGGITWLVEENCYRWPEPENCCILTVARNGYASDIPGIALIEEKKAWDNGTVYLRLRLKNYNGTDWIREVFFINGLCVVFHDTIYANEDGEYVVCAHFKTPGKAAVEGNTLKSVRKNCNGTEYELRLTGYGSAGISMLAEEIPVGQTLFFCGGTDSGNDCYNHGIKLAELGREMWPKRYNENSMVLTAATTRTSSVLKKGEAVSLTHVVQPVRIGGRDADTGVGAYMNKGMGKNADVNVNIDIDIEAKRLYLKHAGKLYEFPAAMPCAHTAEAAIGMEYGYNVLDMKKEADLPGKITKILYLDRNVYACALEGGSLVLLNNGSIQWKCNFEGKIHSLAYAEHNGGMLFVGNGNDRLSALDTDGKIIWEIQVQRIPTIFASWERQYPEVLEIKYGCMGNMRFITAGCGDNQIRVYDMSGTLIKAFYIYATVPDRIDFADVDGDGELEILASGRESSSQGAFYVHDIYGNPGKHIYAGGWLCNIKSYVIRCLAGKIIIACGMNYGENFKIIEIQNGEERTVAAKQLGGTVNAICTDDSSEVYYAGTSMGFITVLDKNGNYLWYLDVKRPVSDIYHVKNGIVAICNDGNIYRISDDGSISGNRVLTSKPACCVRGRDNIIIGCGKEFFSLETK